MSHAKFYKINAPDVVSETIDGETVIINLFKGLYYNLNAIGSLTWTLLIESGFSVDKVIQYFSSQYPDFDDIRKAEIIALLKQLQDEDLIVPVSVLEQSGMIPEMPITGAFESPVLNKYADMQDLLALDPIHDVDETGWPNQPAEILGSANF